MRTIMDLTVPVLMAPSGGRDVDSLLEPDLPSSTSTSEPADAVRDPGQGDFDKIPPRHANPSPRPRGASSDHLTPPDSSSFSSELSYSSHPPSLPLPC
ncbi:hypothetical protein ColTof4_14325 [Colletotrichum tofieldiae]|nr:hypothetical protein ColTof3_14735 [Colletotrichum tofieldiae]GKT81902.1 hypothetical protein ColTof4_14325 [Colletotrichum tofieldiae]